MDNTGVLFNILSLCLALISLVAIVLSFISYRESSRTNLMVNSKEYQIYEDLKYSILQVIASVRSIDAKAAVSIDIKKEYQGKLPEQFKPDYSLEIDIITKLQSSPGYLIFLNSIEDSKARIAIESIFRNLSMKIDLFNDTFIRGAAHLLMKHIKENLNPKLINNKEVYNLILGLCDMEGVFTNMDYETLAKVVDEDTGFLIYLNEHDIVIPDSYTMKDIIVQYADEYKAFQQQTTKDIYHIEE